MITAELQTANVDYLQSKLSGISAYPGGLPSQLIRISGLLLHLSSDCISNTEKFDVHKFFRTTYSSFFQYVLSYTCTVPAGYRQVHAAMFPSATKHSWNKANNRPVPEHYPPFMEPNVHYRAYKNLPLYVYAASWIQFHVW